MYVSAIASLARVSTTMLVFAAVTARGAVPVQPETANDATNSVLDASTRADAPKARVLEIPRDSGDAHFSSQGAGMRGGSTARILEESATDEPSIAKGRDAVYSTRSRGATPAAVSPINPAAALLVLVRDPQSGALMSLALSSEPSAEALIHRGDDEVWVALGPSLPLPPPPPEPPPALEAIPALEYPGADARGRTTARVLPWLGLGLGSGSGLGAGAPIFLGGLIDADAEAAARADTCEGACETIVKRGVVVLARGLPPGYAEMVAASLAARASESHAGLLAIAQDARRWWPSRVPIRSAVVDRAGAEGMPEETLVVTNDPGGRANAGLTSLHRSHLGGVRIPALLETASKSTNPARRARLLQEAIRLGRRVTRDNPSAAMWQANLGLAYALASKNDDRAVVPIQEALRVRPNDVEVLLKVAAVYLARGDRGAAQRVAKRAMKVAPENEDVKLLLNALKSG